MHLKASRDPISWMLVGTPLVAGMVMWASEPALANLRVLSIATMTTAALIAVDARRYKMPPAQYAIATLFFYIGYPWYLHARSKAGGPPMFLAGLCVSAFMLIAGSVCSGVFASVEMTCKLTGEGEGNVECEQQNRGVGPGGACFRAKATRAGDGETWFSGELCTPTLWPGGTSTHRHRGALRETNGHCASASCRVQIVDQRRR